MVLLRFVAFVVTLVDLAQTSGTTARVEGAKKLTASFKFLRSDGTVSLRSPLKCEPRAFNTSNIDWTAYLRRVYGDDVTSEPMLVQNFTFFYYDDFPAGMSFCIVDWRSEEYVPVNVAWRAAAQLAPSANSSAPRPWCTPDCAESRVGRLGFFVNRPLTDITGLTRVEIQHTIVPGPRTDSAWEEGCTWFYHAAGSGVFLDLAQLRGYGRIVQAKDRRAIGMHGTQGWRDISMMSGYLQRNNISVLILGYVSGCSPLRNNGARLHEPGLCGSYWYAAEIIVSTRLLALHGFDHSWNSRSPCTVPDVLLSMGRRPQACHCDSSLDFINCRGALSHDAASSMKNR